MELSPEQIDVIVKWWAAEWQVNESQDKFADALRETLTGPLEPTHGHVDDELVLSVDYDPQGLLLDAVRKVHECRGFMFSAQGILPAKTTMLIRADAIEVSAGRKAPWEKIWQANPTSTSSRRER